jgi:DNA repair protein RadC
LFFFRVAIGLTPGGRVVQFGFVHGRRNAIKGSARQRAPARTPGGARRGIGRDKAVTLVAAFALARRMAGELRTEAPLLDTPEAVVELLREENRLLPVETLQVVLLNTRRRLIRCETVSQGTLDTLLVHAREVFKVAIAANAAALVVAHNHPSGDPSPSDADIKVTRDLIRAGQLLKIEVLDHVILGRATRERPKDYSSLRELGYFAG